MDIVIIARKWIGTRFHYTGRVKINSNNKGGVDCIGLILKVAEEFGMTYNSKNIINYDYLTYSRYPNKGEMKKFFDKYFVKLDKPEIGCVVYFNFTDNLEHAAIWSNIGIIHCYIEAGGVVEHRLSNFWAEKIIGYYKIVKK